MVTYASALDVPRPVVEFLARLLAAHRRRIGTPKRSRALGPFRQAVLVLRWFREHGCVHCLARDAGISQATGYRYLHEGIGVLAAQAPGLHEVLYLCLAEGMTVLSGMLTAGATGSVSTRPDRTVTEFLGAANGRCTDTNTSPSLWLVSRSRIAVLEPIRLRVCGSSVPAGRHSCDSSAFTRTLVSCACFHSPGRDGVPLSSSRTYNA